MSDEHLAFSRRLIDAMRAKRMEPKPAVLLKLFNSRYTGHSVQFSSVAKWLHGESMPRQDKLRVLAEALDVDLQWLRFGDTSEMARVGESRAMRNTQVSAQEQQAVREFLALSGERRRLVRELIAELARIPS